MSQTNVAGLILDPGINLKMQLYLRSGAAMQYYSQKMKNEPGEDLGYLGSFFARINNELIQIGKVSEDEKQNLLNKFYGILKEIYEELNGPITPEKEKELQKNFNYIFNGEISEVGITEEDVKSFKLGVLENKLARGVSDPNKIPQEILERFYNDFDGFSGDSLYFKKDFVVNAEEEYKFIIDLEKKLESQGKLDIGTQFVLNSFRVYFTNQMIKNLNIESPITLEKAVNFQIQLSKLLNLDVSKANALNSTIFLISEEKVNYFQKMLNESQNPKETAQKIVDILLASSVAANEFANISPIVEEWVGYFNSNIALSTILLNVPDEFGIDAFYTELLQKKENIESEIKEIGIAVLPKTKDEKRNLQEQLNLLNEYKKKLEENFLNINEFLTSNKEKGNSDVNKKITFLLHNFGNDISKKMEFLSIILNLNSDKKNNFINKAFYVFNKSSSDSQEVEKSYAVLRYTFVNNIPIQGFTKEDGEINIQALCNFYDRNNEVQEKSQVSIVKSKFKNENKKNKAQQETK